MSKAVELAQVWVPLMPEASRLAGGVKQIAGDAEKYFVKAGKVMGAHLASGVDQASRKVVDTLRDIEKHTQLVTKAKKAEETATAALAKAKAADADATGRIELAEKKLAAVKANARATDLQRAAALEAVNRAKRKQEITEASLTTLTQRHASAEKELAKQTTAAATAETKHQAAQDKYAKMGNRPVRLPLGARLAAQAEQAGSDSGTSFVTGFKRVLGAGAALAAGGGFIASVKSIVDLGVGMESNLNRLQGVTQASAGEMANASKVAQQLGADTTIVGASAADAAAAMLELAKGGLTMQQALAAAPGTLKLAAAAQIDAAAAAESQATILNSYQMGADQADHVADALANIANAAQGEVPDFMLGLQQASAVAHGFNISMDDTVSVLGLFAKAGIRGSDAGTSMKTMLTHLANPSDQASAAMDELGLKIHDAAGNFVGMRELFKQIGEASGKMRPDDFQRAAAELFGTDAIRGAMIAGSQGVQTLDQMREAVTVVGGASRMAAANMQGVPGAIEKVSNAADTAKLKLYDMMKPTLEAGGNKFAGFLNDLPALFDRLEQSDGAKAIADGWRDISGAVKDIAPVIGTVVGQFAKGASGAVIFGWNALGQAMQIIEPPLKWILKMFTAVPGLGTGLAALLTTIYLKSKLAGPALTVASKATEAWGKAFGGWRTPALQAADAMGRTEQASRGFATRIRDAYRSAATESDRFHRTAGVTSGAMSALKSAGGGVLGLLGGPWGAAALGVTTALGLIATAHQNAAEQAEAQRQKEQALLDTLDQTTGKVTEATRSEVKNQMQAKDEYGTTDLGRLKSYGLDPSLGIDAATGTGQAGAYDTIAAKAREHIASGLSSGEGQNLAKLATDAGISTEELNAALLHQGNAMDAVNQKITAYNKAQYDAAEGNKAGWQPAFKDGNALLQSMIDAMSTGDESIITLTQNINQMRDQFDAGAQKAQEGSAALNGVWQDSDALKQKYAELGATITAVPTDKEVVVEVDPAGFAAFKAKMEEAGNTVEQIPGVEGGPAVAKVTANSDQAIQELATLVTKIQNTQAQMDVTVHFRDPSGNEIDRSQLVTPGFVPAVAGETARPRGGGRATGGRVDPSGRIWGPGNGTSDSILARVLGGGTIAVSRGESINTERSTQRNWPLIDAMNKGWVPPASLLRRIAGFSGGGDIDDVLGPGYGASEAEWVARAMPLGGHGAEGELEMPPLVAGLRLAGQGLEDAAVPGEGLVRKIRNAAARSTFDRLKGTDGSMPLLGSGLQLLASSKPLRGYSGGGLVGEDAIYEQADSMVGTKYNMASGDDCSGSISQLVNRALGLPAKASRMATGNAAEWLAGKGAVIGDGPPGTFRISWKNGGPGGGHMAATLPDGTNVEQGGSHGVFTMGSGAAGADDPQFTNHAYFPLDALYPEGSGGGGGGASYYGGGGSGGGYGGGGGASAADQRALRNAGQKVDDTAYRLKQAQDDLDALNAKGTATAKQKEAAEHRVTVAEREHNDAINDRAAKQEEVNRKGGRSADGKNSGPDAAGMGQGLLKGALEGLGFDGETFSDPTQWGIFKMGTGLANIFGGVLKNWNWEGMAHATDGGQDMGRPFANLRQQQRHGLGGSPGPGNTSDGGLGDFNFGDGGGAGLSAAGDTLLPQVRDFLPNSQQQGPQQVTQNIDNRLDFSGSNNGMDPKALKSQMNSEQNARTRTTSVGLPTS